MTLHFYYTIRPLIPRRLQIFLRRMIARKKRHEHRHIWPIDASSGTVPADWPGWPDQKRFALVLSHDVDTQKGHDQVEALMAIERQMGFRSAYNFVPERYNLSLELIEKVKRYGFEVNIHGLKHDGKLFKNRSVFDRRAMKINQYIKDWDITGFTAPSMICNLDWIHQLNVTHTTCTFDTDPFEPQPSPSKTIFPFIRSDPISGHRFVELPYTLPQDHTLFVILQEKSIDVWKEKLRWIAERGGMALMNTHPDYIRFSEGENGSEEYRVELYIEFLEHVRADYAGQFWNEPSGVVGDYILSQVDDKESPTQPSRPNATNCGLPIGG